MTAELPFEKALEKLEKIVSDLESGEVPLEEALKKYEEGVKLSRLCQGKLSQAEKKIEMLSRGLDGTLTKVPFEPSEGDEDVPEPRKPATRKTKALSDNEAREDLL